MTKAMAMWKTSCALALLIVVTGFDAPRDENEGAGDTSEGFADETSTEITEAAQLGGDIVIETRFCEGGWPYHRVCEWQFGDGRPIDTGSVHVIHKAHAGIGALSYDWDVLGGNVLKVTVTMHEGDLLDPNKHIALMTIVFTYL